MNGLGNILERSHRTSWSECKWWKKTTSSDDLSKEVYNRECDGEFLARETANDEAGGMYDDRMNKISSFMVESNTVTICTYDEVDGIKPNDAVFFQGYIWRVDGSVRKMKSRKKDMYSESDNYTYYIPLKR